jgi:hypothetical protein
MGSMRNVAGVTLVVGVAVFVAVWLSVESRAQTPDVSALSGAWTLNHDASDHPPAHGGAGPDSGRGRRGGGGYGGGGGRGGYRGGGGGRPGGNGEGRDPEQMARIREALRDIMNPPEHLTIAQSGTMVILTAPDGRTTRLSTDGSKIKDENTKVERKTRWDGARLVSEITGLPQGKITQTFAVDPEHHQLRVTVNAEGGRSGQTRTFTQVYDADAR